MDDRMSEGSLERPLKLGHTLSARLLLLTIGFVMLAEVLIWTPSIARYRKNFIEDYIARSYLSMLALDAMPDTEPNPDLELAMLRQVEARAIILNRPDRRMLMVTDDMPPAVDLTVDLGDTMFTDFITGAFETLLMNENRVIRAIGMPPKQPGVTVEVLFDESNLRAAMLDFSARILTLSIVISLITATLVYFSLQWLIVRPIGRLTRSMVRFSENPEDATRVVDAENRDDEIGVAQRELATMQRQVQTSLRQKNRLAALGTAMTKINHDLRNTLATAVLVSDKLQAIEDPEVKRVTPRLMKAIDRAVDLCSQTLNYAAADSLILRPSRFSIRELIDDVQSQLEMLNEAPAVEWRVEIDDDTEIVADRRHLLRALHNLAANAIEAGASVLVFSATPDGGQVAIDVADNGPGLPEKARQNLFQPFAGSGRTGGTGLGLAIVRDIAGAHGGEVALVETGPGGTRFRIRIPDGIQEMREAGED